MGGGWWCCCSCDIGSDNFDRADSSSLGSDWTEDAGAWSIASNKLTTSSINAIAEYQTAHPDSEAQHWVSVSVTFSSDGDKARILLSDNVAVELEYDTTNAQTLRVFDNGSNVGEKVYTISGSTFTLVASYREDDGTAVAYINAAGNCIQGTIASSATNYQVSLGTGDTNAGGIDFDNFDYRKANSTTNPTCPDISCYINCSRCNVGTGKFFVAVTLPSMIAIGCSDCSNLSGMTAVLSQISACEWETDVDVSLGDCGTNTMNFNLTFGPGSYAVTSTVWTFTLTYPSGNSIAWENTSNDSADCDQSASVTVAVAAGSSWECENSVLTLGNVTVTPQ